MSDRELLNKVVARLTELENKIEELENREKARTESHYAIPNTRYKDKLKEISRRKEE